MKKIIILFLCLMTVSVYGQNISAWWGFGTLDFSLYKSENIKWEYTNSVDLLDVTVMDSVTGLYLDLCPFHVDSFPGDRPLTVPEQKSFMSYANAKLSWNIIRNSERIAMGPFALIRWNPFEKEDCYQTELGFEAATYSPNVLGRGFPLRAKSGHVHAGIGLRRGEPYFTIGVGLDVFTDVYRTIYGEAFLLDVDD